MLPTTEFPCLYILDLDLYIVPYAHLEMEFLQLLASNHLIGLIGPVVKVSASTVDIKGKAKSKVMLQLMHSMCKSYSKTVVYFIHASSVLRKKAN